MRREGIRRLALAIGVVGMLAVGISARSEIQDLLRQQRNYSHFRKERRAHPSAELLLDSSWGPILREPARRATAVYAGLPAGFEPIDDPAAVPYEERFPPGSDSAPAAREFLWITFLMGIGFFLPWAGVNSAAWVIDGFGHHPTP